MNTSIIAFAAIAAANILPAAAEVPTSSDSIAAQSEQPSHKVKYAPIDLDTDNGVVSLAGSKGFTIQTKKGDFIFKPYMLVQTSGNFNWYDDELSLIHI